MANTQITPKERIERIKAATPGCLMMLAGFILSGALAGCMGKVGTLLGILISFGGVVLLFRSLGRYMAWTCNHCRRTWSFWTMLLTRSHPARSMSPAGHGLAGRSLTYGDIWRRIGGYPVSSCRLCGEDACLDCAHEHTHLQEVITLETVSHDKSLDPHNLRPVRTLKEGTLGLFHDQCCRCDTSEKHGS